MFIGLNGAKQKDVLKHQKRLKKKKKKRVALIERKGFLNVMVCMCMYVSI